MTPSRPRASRPTVLASLVLAGAVALSLSACGDDQQAGGSDEAFCADYAQFSQAEFLDGVDTTDVYEFLEAHAPH